MLNSRNSFAALSTLFLIASLLITLVNCNANSSDLSIYEVLDLHGLPMGLLPKGIKNFTYDGSKFEAYLDRACNAKFENELHYDLNVSGSMSFGQIAGLSGMKAQDLFLWFPVKEIRVDVPSSGLIYFDVGVVSKQFSLSLFETPRDCLAAQIPEIQRNTVKIDSKIRHELDEDIVARAVL